MLHAALFVFQSQGAQKILGSLLFVFFLISCERASLDPVPAPVDSQADFLDPNPEALVLEAAMPAPNFELSSMDGRLFRLSDFRGQYVLLNFWATWCAPCIRELPSMEELNQRFKSRAFSMLAVSVDSSWQEIAQFKARLQGDFSFLILLDNSRSVAEGLYRLEKYPESFLIGPNGQILRKFVGAVEWTSPEVLRELDALMSSSF